MTENLYKELKDKHQKEFNDFPMFFAFSNKQFYEGMEKLGLKPSETDKIYKLGDTGGYYRKTDSKALHELFDRHEKEMKKAIASDDKFVYDMFNYELGNHEYVITYDVSDTLSALGLSKEEVNNDERLSSALKKACKEQIEWYELHG